jgi:1-acylglycerone phosphate reductase
MVTVARTVLITGCSDGGMGAALATAFHQAGLQVYATARNAEKMRALASLGIRTLVMDVQSESSIAACVAKVPGLDILVNNAGAVDTSPIVDADISKGKELFDLNVWSYVAVTQAFLPLLLRSANAMIVNQTSTQAVTVVPFAGIYGASKAAVGIITQNLRLELQPFNIKVIEMRTGEVQTNIIKNFQKNRASPLPRGSIYTPAKAILENIADKFDGMGPTVEEWADSMSKQLLKENPVPVIWSGAGSSTAWWWTWYPFGWSDTALKRMTGLDDVERVIRGAM